MYHLIYGCAIVIFNCQHVKFVIKCKKRGKDWKDFYVCIKLKDGWMDRLIDKIEERVYGKQNYPLCRLILVIETFEHSTL